MILAAPIQLLLALVDGPSSGVGKSAIRERDFEVAPTDDELRATLSPEQLVPMLVDAAAHCDALAASRPKERRADLERARDELVAEIRSLTTPGCRSCRRSWSEVDLAVDNDRGQFCGDCTKAAMRWPA